MLAQYFQNQGMFVLKLFIAALLAYFIAFDRRTYGKGAGMRTYALISMGSCLFTIASMNFTGTTDPSRIAAGIVTGIGFIGAGIIWQRKDNIIGITTAAGVWVAAAIGLTIALDLWLVAISTALFVVIIFNSKKYIPYA